MFTFHRKYTKVVLVDNLIESSLTNFNKEKPTKMNFGSVFRPLYYLSRIWGMAPFSITTNSNGEVQKPKIHLFDGLWFLITICVYLFFTNYAWNAFQTSRGNLDKETWILILSARLLAIFAFVYGILMVIINVCNRFKLITMVKMFNRFDKEVHVNTAFNLLQQIFDNNFSLFFKDDNVKSLFQLYH